MKRLFPFRSAIILSAILIVVASCNRSKLTTANANLSYGFEESVPVVSYPMHVPLPSNGLSLAFPQYPINTDYQQHMTDNSTDTGLITSFRLNNLTLQISVAPNFDFMDSVGVYLSTDSLKEVLIAYNANIPKGANQISLTSVSGLDLKNYFLTDVINYRIHANLDSVPVTGASVNLNSVYSLSAKLLN